MDERGKDHMEEELGRTGRNTRISNRPRDVPLQRDGRGWCDSTVWRPSMAPDYRDYRDYRF